MTGRQSKEAMEDALRDAVARMNQPEARAETNGVSSDPIRLATAVLSKLMESHEGRDSVAEKLDELREDLKKGDGEQSLLVRKYLHRVMKTQSLQLAEMRQLRVDLHAIHTQTSAMGEAIVEIYEVLGRLSMVESTHSDVRESGFPPPRVSGAPGRPEDLGQDVSARHKATKRRVQRTPRTG